MLRLTTLHVIKNPAGSFSFVGRVPIVLGYVRKDGQPLTEEDQGFIQRNGISMRMHVYGTRVFPAREIAVETAEGLGFSVQPS